MERLLWVLAIAFVVCAPCAYADDIPTINVNITYVTASMGPNAGSGDNVYFTLFGSGTVIVGYGGMACSSWCFGPIPDSTPVFTSQIFVGAFTSATIHGVSYDASELGLLCCIFSSSGELNPSVSGHVGSGDAFANLNLTLPCCGGWDLQFETAPPQGDFRGGIRFVLGTFTAGTPPSPVPEPGTLGLMASGLAGLLGVMRRKGPFAKTVR